MTAGRYSVFVYGLVAAILCACLNPLTAEADEFRPALLSLTEKPGDRVDIIWKRPMRGDQVPPLRPALPTFLEAELGAAVRVIGGAQVERMSYRTNGQTLAGETISVLNFDGLSMDVLVQVHLIDSTQYSAILTAGNPSFAIPLRQTSAEVAVAYWKMGTIHILEGADHLLFIVALLLIVQGLWPLIKTITAFTIAHSITLVLATLGYLGLPSAPTEAVIALSIVLLAVEVVRKQAGETTLAEKLPWMVAFGFGLVHGLGFAGALAEIGLPQTDVPLALLMFNLGVETGQVVFVVAISFLLAVLSRLHLASFNLVERTTPYVIGGVAAFWTIQRIVPEI